MGKVLILRNCNSDMTSYKGFIWPKSGPVEAPDWNPKPECGGGLHGLLWGDGDWSLLRDNPDTIWQVVEVEETDLVKIDEQKVKFHKGKVIFAGDMGRAITNVLCSQIRFKWLCEQAKEKSSGDYSTSASSGSSSKSASSGSSSTSASSGSSSKSASSGSYSTSASSGDCSTSASSGSSSKSASSGDYSTSASSGDYSTSASSGSSSKSASSGSYSTAEAQGENTIAMVAGIGGKVKVGPNGAFAIAYLGEGNHPRILVGHVGEKGIKADTWYFVKNGRLTTVK